MKLFTWLDSEVRLHWSLFIPFAVVSFNTTYLMVLFTSYVIILAHEFGHIAAARKFGMKVPQIWLSAIGGAALCEDKFSSAYEEFVTTLCGPLVNVVLMFLAVPLTLFVPGGMWFMVINLYILLFNLIPAYPMDGGRLLHACLWFLMSKEMATKVCVVLSVVLAGLGLYLAFLEGFWILGIISVFVVFSAVNEWNDGLTNSDS